MPLILHVNHEDIALDEDNFLLIQSQWSPAFSEALADHLNITLSPLHWTMMTLLRGYYDENGKVPTLRYVVQQLRQQAAFKDINSSDLYHAFTDQPLKQACQLAGLPKPPHCL